MSQLRIGDQKGGLQRDQASANAWTASRINCDWVARLSLRCGLLSAPAASLNERCIVRSVACCFAFRRDPHSIACSVLTKIGIRRVFSACLCAAPLCQFFIGRFFDCQRAKRHNKALLPALSNVVYGTLVLCVRNRLQQSTACLSRYGAAIAPRPTGSTKLVSDDFPVFHWRHDARISTSL